MQDNTSERRVIERAVRQAGCIARRQVHEAGMTDSMIRNRLDRGRWQRPHPGVYVVAGTPKSWQRDLWAAVLAAGPATVVSHESALLVHGVPHSQLRRYPITLTASPGSHHRVQGAIVHQIGDVQPHHVADIGGLTVSRPSRAIIDLAAELNVRRLGALLDRLLTERQVTLSDVTICLAEVARPGKRGMRTLGVVLQERGEGYVPPASELERLLADALAQAGLPEPLRQIELPGRGAIEGLVDAGYRDARLLIEADGRRWHSRIEDQLRDRQREAEAARVGWMTMRFLYEQIVNEPGEVAATVADVRRIRLTQFASSGD